MFFALAFAASLFPAPVNAGVKPCYQDVVQYHWLLDLRKQSVKRLAKSGESTAACETFERDAQDNLELEVSNSKGRVVYHQVLFVQLDEHFDTVVTEGNGKDQRKHYEGGVRAASSALVTTSLPDSIARFDAHFKIRFIALATRKVLGEGAL